MDTNSIVGRQTNGLRTLPKTFCRIIILVIALIGVSVQVYQISDTYFRYSTKTNVLVNVENDIESPALSICIKTLVFIKIDEEQAKITFNQDDYHQILLYQKQPNRVDEHGNLLYNKLLTLNRIFKFAKNVSYHACYYRNPNDQREIINLNKSECDSMFMVDKYVTEDLVCYRFQLATFPKYQFRQNMEAANAPGFIYGMVITFDDHKLSLTPNVHSPDSYGSISRLYPAARMNLGLQNYMRLSYARYSVTRLPRPYQTMCRSLIDSYTQTGCLKQCGLTQMTSLGVLPYAEEYDNNDLTNYGNWSIVSLTDKRISAEQFQSNRKKCAKACDDNCYDEWYTTDVQEVENRTVWSMPWFLLRVDLPNRPFTAIEHKPQLLFNEYVIYVMSCFGAWLGISFLDLNPFKSRNGAYNRPATAGNFQTRACIGCRQSQLYCQLIMKEANSMRRTIRDMS